MLSDEVNVMVKNDPPKFAKAKVDYLRYAPEITDKYVNVRSISFIEDGRLCIIYNKNGHPAFPGGRIEPGESPDEAMRREMLEEANAEIIEMTPFASIRYTWQDDGAVEYILFYKSKISLLSGEIDDPDKEIQRRELIDKADVFEKLENRNYVKWLWKIMNSEDRS